MTKVTTEYFGEINFFPYEPQAPMSELLEWNSSVTNSIDGTEDRDSNVEEPSQTLEMTFPLDSEKKREAFNSLYGAIRETWYFPLWAESQYVGDITDNQTVIDCNTILYNFNMRDVTTDSIFVDPALLNSSSSSSVRGIASDGEYKYYVDSSEVLHKVDEHSLESVATAACSYVTYDITVNDTYVITLSSGWVRIFDKTTLSLLSNTLAVLSSARRISCDNSYLFIVSPLGKKIAKCNFSGIIIGSSVVFDGNNSHADVAIVTDHVYVAQYFDDTIKRYSVSGLSYVGTTTLENVLSIASYGGYLYAISGTTLGGTSVTVYSEDMSIVGGFSLPVLSIDFSVNEHISSCVSSSIYDIEGPSGPTEACLGLLMSGENQQVVDITGTTSGNITVDSVDAISSAYLMPVKRGFIVGDVAHDTDGFSATEKIKFLVDDNLEFSESTPAQYLGDDVYYDIVPEKTGDMVQKKIMKDQLLANFKLGPVDVSSYWTNSRVGFPFKKTLYSHSEVYDFRDFLYRRAGRYRQFWSPSFEYDLKCVSVGLINEDLLVESDSIIDYVQDRTHIAILATDGFYRPREITSFYQVDANRVSLSLNSWLELYDYEVASICFLGLYRLNSDKIKITWTGNSQSTISTGLLEVAP